MLRLVRTTKRRELLGPRTTKMDIRPVVWWVQIWDFWFHPPSLCEKRKCDWMVSTCLLPSLNHGGDVIIWGWWCWWQNSLWFGLSWTIIWLFNRTLTPNTPPDYVRAFWSRRRVTECCIRWPGLMVFDELDGRVKEKQGNKWEHLQNPSRWLPHEAN